MTQQVMNQAEGAVLRIQLDSMIGALAQFDALAGDAGDEDVLQLIARLYEARDAAAAIEQRTPLKTQGVTLTRN